MRIRSIIIRKITIRKVILLLLILFSENGWSKKFSTHLVEFDLPIDWDCEQRQGDWLCHHKNSEQKREAIIAINAKRREGNDTLENYKKHLKRRRNYRTGVSKKDNQSYISQSKFVRTRLIKKHTWVESLHLGSEIPDFYTHYIATVKGESAIAVSFTVAKDQYGKYLKHLQDTLSSLRFFNQKNIQALDINHHTNQDQKFLDFSILDNEVEIDKQPVKEKGGGSGAFWLILLVLGGLGFFFYRKKRSKKTQS